MATDPKSITSLTANQSISVPLNDPLRSAVAAAIDSGTAPTPTPPTMTVMRAPTSGPRGDGWVRTNPAKDYDLRDTVVDGFEQNVVLDGVGSAAVTNVVSINPHRASPRDFFKGQCLFVHAAKRGVKVSGFAGIDAGWPPLSPRLPMHDRLGYFHAIYYNWGSGDSLIEDLVVIRASHSGAQTRAILEDPDDHTKTFPQRGHTTSRTVKILRAVCIDSGIAVMPVAGIADVEDLCVYGARRWWDGASWTGNLAISSYTETILRDVTIVGKPGQDRRMDEPGAEKFFNMGAVMGSQRYTKPAVSTGARWTVQGECTIRAWPGAPFTGDAPCPAAGWRMDARPAPVVQYEDVVTALSTGGVAVRDARAELAHRIRSAA